MSTTATTINPAKAARLHDDAAYELPVFESVACLACGGRRATHFLTGEDDLTGKPGRVKVVQFSAIERGFN